MGRTDVPDFDMLDAMIAYALKNLLNTQMHVRKRVSVEEQRAQKYDRFLRGRQIARMIYEYFRATRVYEAVPGLSDLFIVSLQSDDVRRDHALLSVSQNYRILPNFWLWWLYMIKRTTGNKGKTPN